MCPCQVHVESCSLNEYGRIIYVCMAGYTGYECKEVEGRPIQPSYTTNAPQTQPPYVPYSDEIVYINPKYVDDSVGSNIKLTCQSAQPQQFAYIWYKDNRNVEMGRHIFAYENVLIIRTAAVEDSGEYKCEARNNENVFTSTVVVNIRSEENSFR